MNYRGSWLGLVIVLSIACGGKDGDDGTTGGGSGDTTTSSSTSPTTTDASTTGPGTTGATATATGTGTDSGTTTTGSTGTSSATGVDVSGFDFFRLSNAAGPCPPDKDCDGFVELLSTGMLRVEKFGDVTDEVIEVMISAEDFAAAAQVFAHPDLVAVLDGPDPLCQPPTDIFESMELLNEGVLHDAATTTCAQVPLVAARETAVALRMQYAP